MAASATLAGRLDLPFAEQIAFFRQKLDLPTERWDDIWQAAHDRAFVVAGAAKADLLADLRAAVERGIAEGRTLKTFRKDFREIVRKYGWTGWTGEGTAEGEAWRTRVIFETNLRTSYAAGRWRQLTDPALLTERPYWRYVHNDLVLSPRPHHKAWGDARLTLRHDHPFWQTHYPPNGWGCRCRVVAERAPREGDATEPPAGWNTAEAKTGAPPGIDKGWAYAPGGSWFPDLDKYPYAVAREIVAASLADGVFARWVARIDEAVDAERRALPDLSKAELTAELRKRLGAEEKYPVAVLAESLRDWMKVSTQTVVLSDYDLIKQAVSRTGQNFDALSYFNLQQVLDEATLIVRENAQMTIFVSAPDGTWYAAILQQTQTGKGVFLKSFRRSSEKDARLQAKKGEVLKSDL